MAAFNKYYDEHEKLLPEPRNGIKDWLENETWKEIMRRAGDTLAVLLSQ